MNTSGIWFRTPLLEIILDELTYDRVMLSQFLEVFICIFLFLNSLLSLLCTNMDAGICMEKLRKAWTPTTFILAQWPWNQS